MIFAAGQGSGLYGRSAETIRFLIYRGETSLDLYSVCSDSSVRPWARFLFEPEGRTRCLATRQRMTSLRVRTGMPNDSDISVTDACPCRSRYCRQAARSEKAPSTVKARYRQFVGDDTLRAGERAVHSVLRLGNREGHTGLVQTFLILLRPVNPSLFGMGTAAEWRALQSPYRGHFSGACRQACRSHRGSSFRQEVATPRDHASSPVVTAGQPKTISRSDGICQLHGLPRRILEVALTVIANVVDLIPRRKQFVV